MPKREERFSIRLDLQGGREVAAGLERIGAEGERSLSRIRTMSVTVTPWTTSVTFSRPA